MNPLWLVMGFLLLAYLGSFVVSRRGVLGVRSNVGWIVVGFVLGPSVLAVIGTTLLEAIDPVVTVATGWVAFVAGTRVGRLPPHPSVRTTASSRARDVLVFGVVAGALVCGVAYLAIPWVFPAISADVRLPAALACGAVASGSSSELPLAVRHRLTGTEGPVGVRLTDLGDIEVVVPLVAVQAVVVLCSRDGSTLVAVGSLVLGPLLGAMTVPLLGTEEDFRLREGWGALLGVAALAVGLSVRAGLFVPWVLFSLGATLVRVSRHYADVQTIVAPTERSLLLPLLVLVGVRLDVSAGWILLPFVLVALVVRLGTRVLAAGVFPSGSGARATLVGLASTSQSPLVVIAALSLATTPLAARTAFTTVTLPLAVAVVLVGEAIGPLAFRATLFDSGEARARFAPRTKAVVAPVSPSDEVAS